MIFSSKLIEEAVDQIAQLPGIGKKTALRLVFFLLREKETYTEQLSQSLLRLRKEIKYCQQCFNLSDMDICAICKMPSRDKSLLCIVETTTDLFAIENTGQYNGLYHVLGGKIVPADSITPDDIRVKELIEKVENGEIKEVILALSATIDADTTVFYLSKKLKIYPIKITVIARGIPVGNEIEYTDPVTLGRSIIDRVVYK